MYKLLESVTLDSAEHRKDFDLTAYSDYDYIIVVVNTTLSASDWIYLRINGTRQNKYTDKSRTYGNVPIALCKSGKAAGWVVAMAYSGSNITNTVYLMDAKPNSIGFEPYTAETKFGAGSTFKIYGAKLPS